MSNDADMRFLLKEIADTEAMIAVFEEDEKKYASELRNYRQKIKGSKAELASLQNK